MKTFWCEITIFVYQEGVVLASHISAFLEVLAYNDEWEHLTRTLMGKYFIFYARQSSWILIFFN